MRSERLTALLDRWRNDLHAVIESPRPQVGTAGELARERLRRAASRVAHRANAITPESLDEDVHALRKRAKELRYLLTVFAPLCRPCVYRALVTDLKAIQDVSGRFQNGSVQAEALRDYAAEMALHPDVSAPSLLVMDELATRMQQRRARTRSELTDLLEPFAAEVPRRVETWCGDDDRVHRPQRHGHVTAVQQGSPLCRCPPTPATPCGLHVGDPTAWT